MYARTQGKNNELLSPQLYSVIHRIFFEDARKRVSKCLIFVSTRFNRFILIYVFIFARCLCNDKPTRTPRRSLRNHHSGDCLMMPLPIARPWHGRRLLADNAVRCRWWCVCPTQVCVVACSSCSICRLMAGAASAGCDGALITVATCAAALDYSRSVHQTYRGC